MDLNHAETDELIRQLVAKVDVVVENFGPGVMQRRRWDFDSLIEINPKLVMASVSAFGRTGPLAHKTGFDWIAQASAGIMHMTGPKDGPPHPDSVVRRADKAVSVRDGGVRNGEHRDPCWLPCQLALAP